MRRGASRGAMILAAVAAVAAVAAAGIGWALLLGRRVRRASRAASSHGSPDARMPGPADAIVVFGATVDAAGPCAELRARLDHAATLWRAGVAPVVLAAGGVACGIDEVEAMCAYLVARGVPPEAALPAHPGDNTRRSLRTARDLGYRRIVGVSSPYHAHRIEVEGWRQGLEVEASAPRSTPETRHAPTHRARFASEVVAAIFYALPASMTGRVHTGPGTLRHVAPDVLAGRVAPTALLRRRRPHA